MEVKEIADNIMELWQMDGYKCLEPPLFESTINHTRTHTALIVSIKGNYEPVKMFCKTPIMSMRGQSQPASMLVNVIDDVIIIIYENVVYGVKNKEIKFIEEI
ncbi:terminal repeat-encoded protein [Staphylococcus phage phiSA12]|uniref:Terminal repeat-encoded protein n=1 Tax=Staphylococcus phage phiSA12 TaxID=1450142 RepID=W0TXX1_9CAUD|nr:terminal repeat-encoded protein [Staphylococcus phage phiSA12]BAO47249.1 terminal repeat-encoded protein [Staphylococcus phage phiSA12]